MNHESEILQKKDISESNTINNMKLMILTKIWVIHTCSSSPHTASVSSLLFCVDFLLSMFLFFRSLRELVV